MSSNNSYNLLSPQMQQHLSNILFFQAQQTNNQQVQNVSDLQPLANNTSPTQQQQQQYKEIQLDQGFITPQIQLKTGSLPKNKSVTSFTSTQNLKTIENMQNWMDFKPNGVNTQNQINNTTQNGPLFSIPAENPSLMQMHLSKLALSGENQLMSSSFDNNINSQCVLPSPLVPWDLCNLNSGNNNNNNNSSNMEFLGRLHMDPNRVSSIESTIEHNNLNNNSSKMFSNSYGSGINLFQYDQLTFPQKQNSLPFGSDNNNNVHNSSFQNTFINNNNNSCNNSGNKPLVSKFQSQSRENINMFPDLMFSPFSAAAQHPSPQSTQINFQVNQQQQQQQPYLISPNLNSQQNLLLAATQIINGSNNLNGIQNSNNGSFIIPQTYHNNNTTNDSHKQQCLIEEQEEDESSSRVNKCPLVKAEHVSEDLDSEYLKSHKQQDIPRPAQLLGQISATLIDRQARLQKKQDEKQGSSSTGKEVMNINSKASRNNSTKRNQDKAILTSELAGDFGEDESDIEKAKKICDQQAQLLRSLGSQFQMQPIFQQAYSQFEQSREFQTPVNPLQLKHMKYINPLCQIYQNILQQGNIPQNNPRLRQIQNIILNSKLSTTFVDLPSNYNDSFQENLSFLIETIHKESLVRQNPHLIFGGKDSNKQPSTLIPSQSQQPKTQQNFAAPSSSSLEFKQRVIPPISPNEAHSFSIRHTLKKIDSDFTTPNQSSNTPASFNSINPCVLSNTQLPRSGIEEDFSPDSFSEYRKRQLSAFSLGPNMTGMHSPIISKQLSCNSQPQISPPVNSSERTLLNLYGQFSGKDKERSRQFSTAKNSQGNQNTIARSPGNEESQVIMKRSKYHNLTKLFMYFLLSLFQAENMTRLNVPDHIQQELIKCIQNVKKTAKKKIKNKNLQKTDFFNHTHYNVLFLHLNKKSLKELQKKEKDILVHQQCFGLDIANIDVQRLEFVNILKKFAFEIVINTLESPSESDCIKNPRNEYMLKALSGIRQLAQGNVIFRFQQVYNNNNVEKQED